MKKNTTPIFLPIQHGISAIAIVLIVAGVLVSLLAIVALSKSRQPKNPTPPSQATPPEATDWSTYTSEKDGYSIQHPSDWKVDENTQDELSGNTPYTYIYIMEGNTKAGVQIIRTKQTTPIEWVNAHDKDNVDILGNSQIITAGGASGILLNKTGAGGDELGIAFFDTSTHTIIIYAKGNKKLQTTFRQALTTLVIVDKTTLTPTPPKSPTPTKKNTSPTPTAKATSPSPVPTTKTACEAKGGTWQQWGLRNAEFCQIPSSDAGKSCTDGSQCSTKLCIAKSRSVPGTCANFPSMFGCFATITNGTVGPTMCVD